MHLFTTICVLSLLCGSALGFVFSCEEVKYKLINQGLEEPTKFVCLIPQEGFSAPEAFDRIYAQNDKVSTSFTDLLNATCVQRPGSASWQIVADPVNLDCSQEFTLIFTSSNVPLVTVKDSLDKMQSDSTEVLVSPRTGIKVNFYDCQGSGDITIYTGAGQGVSEYRFMMKTWTCATLPTWLVAFDNAITIEHVGVLLAYDFYRHDYKTDIPVLLTDRLAVISSGRSDNLQNLHADQNIARFTVSSGVTMTSDITSTFDGRYNGYVSIFGDDSAWALTYHNDTAHIVKDASKSIKVAYGSNSIAQSDLWDSQDNFVVEMGLAQQAAAATGDKYCNCAVDDKFHLPIDWDTQQIWIDLVIILDTSEAMGETSLISATNLIESFIGDSHNDVLITNTNSQFYTRVGLIAMSDTADVMYSLNMTKYDDVTGKVHIKKGVTSIDVMDAFSAAQQMFAKEITPDRVNTRQVIYYMTNSDPDFNPNGVNQFKTSKGTIIVNNFLAEGDTEKPNLKNLASPGYYRSDIQYDYMDTIQLFCKANCYCLAPKDAYAGLSNDKAIIAGGGCFIPNTAGYPWTRHEDSCAQMGNNGTIVSLHDMAKSTFVQKLLAKNVNTDKVNYFWIGYSKNDAGAWEWEDQSPSTWTNWNLGDGEPSPAPVAKCTYASLIDPSVNWGAGNCQVGFPSVCEFPPCMAGNKC